MKESATFPHTPLSFSKMLPFDKFCPTIPVPDILVKGPEPDAPRAQGHKYTLPSKGCDSMPITPLSALKTTRMSIGKPSIIKL